MQIRSFKKLRISFLIYFAPMQFNSITGQKDTKEQLVQMIQHNRLSHALLFLGKEGSGALQLAQAFAQYIVCEKVNGRQTTDNRPQTTNHKPQTKQYRCWELREQAVPANLRLPTKSFAVF